MHTLRRDTRKYTKVLVLGKEQNRDSVHEALAQRKDTTTLVIGDGESPITPDKILEELNNNRNNIDPHTVFSLIIHGTDTRTSKGHYQAHNINGEENTEEIIKAINGFSRSLLSDIGVQDELTKIILDSCYAGTAQHIDLPDNTLLFACGTQYHATLSNFPLSIKNLDLLQKRSTKALGRSLSEMGETCYIIKKATGKEQEAKKIRRPKTENDFKNTSKYYQGQFEDFKKIIQEFPKKIFSLKKFLQKFNKDKAFDKDTALKNGFFNTVYKGKSSQLDFYLKNGIDVFCQNEDGKTALYYAIPQGHHEVIAKLLERLTPAQKIAFKNKQDNSEETALHLAASQGNVQVMNKLLEELTEEQALALKKQQNNVGKTALHCAAIRGDVDIIDTLLNGLSPEQEIDYKNQQDNKSLTALHCAASQGHTDVINKLLAGLEDEIDYKNKLDNAGRTALHLAAFQGHTGVIKRLLERLSLPQKNTYKNQQDNNGYTALHHAASQGHHKVINILLAIHTPGQIDKQDNNGFTALHHAAFQGHHKVIDILLAVHTPDQLNKQDNNGFTALHLAASQGHHNIIDALLNKLNPEDKVIFINQKDKKGLTALEYAAQKGHTNVIKRLQEELAQAQQISL